MLNSNFEEHAKKVLEKWNYQTIRKIGKGGFGHVVLASKFSNYMSFYAIKCFLLKSNTKDANLKKYIEQQVKIMCHIDHPNIVRYETSFQDSGWYFIVMEYCDKGNLFNYQSKMPSRVLGLSESCKIMIQILKGIQTLHSQNIIHRDIKCENIFLKKNKNSSQYKCKIGDFGFAKQIDQYTKTSCGTTLFMAPEVLKKLPYSYEADIWSLGVVFYFMLFGDYPFKNINIQKQIFDKCVNGYFLADNSNLYKDRQEYLLLQDFFKRVFDLDQDRRMKIEQMKNHKIFNSDEDGTEDSFTNDQQQEQLDWCLAKVKFVEDMINDITSLKYLEPYLLHSTRFYLFKVSLSILRQENIMNARNEQSKYKQNQDIPSKQVSITNNLARQYQILQKILFQTKRISKFNQGFNLDVQDFYSIKQGYRNTLSAVYSETQKKIGNENLKAQLKLRVLCCHLINRVFSKGLKADVFPHFNNWVKKNAKKDAKKEHDLSKLKQWIQVQSPEKLSGQIDNINKKFYC